MPADVTLTKVELRMLIRLASRDYIQKTENSDRVRASIIAKAGAALAPTQPDTAADRAVADVPHD